MIDKFSLTVSMSLYEFHFGKIKSPFPLVGMVFAFSHLWDCDFHVWVILFIEAVGIISLWDNQIAWRLHAFPFC